MLKRSILTITLATTVAIGASAGASPALAADCGTMNYKGRSMWFDANGVGCARARVLLRRYIDRGTVPSGYRCQLGYRRSAPKCFGVTIDAYFGLTAPH